MDEDPDSISCLAPAASTAPHAEPAPVFDEAFRQQFETLLRWRRDVRRFRRDPIPEELIDRLLDLGYATPSVGNSQPWRWVRVDSPESRAAVKENFRRCNSDALARQSGDRMDAYARLKLEGLDEAPLHLAAFCDRGTSQGHGLGCLTMPQTLDYSVVIMIANFWLAARAMGLGVGWISILDPVPLADALRVPTDWTLIAYLCIGWPQEEHTDPELERFGWQARRNECRKVLSR